MRRCHFWTEFYKYGTKNSITNNKTYARRQFRFGCALAGIAGGGYKSAIIVVRSLVITFQTIKGWMRRQRRDVGTEGVFCVSLMQEAYFALIACLFVLSFSPALTLSKSTHLSQRQPLCAV